MRLRAYTRVLVPVSVFIFFLQAIRVLFSMLFGILYDQLFAGEPGPWLVGSLLLVFGAFLFPAVVPANPSRAWPEAAAIAAAVGRLALSVNQADVRFWGALIVVAAGGAYLAMLFRTDQPAVLPSLLAAFALEHTLRAAGLSFDLSLRSLWLPVQVLWSLLVGWLALRADMRHYTAHSAYKGPGWSGGLALGSVLFLEMSVLVLPGGMASWSVPKGEALLWNGSLQTWLAVSILVLLWLPLFPAIRQEVVPSLCRNRAGRLAVGMFLAASLMVAYFLSGNVALVTMLIAQALTLVALSCFLRGPTPQRIPPGPKIALGMLLFLVLNFAHAFAFTYPYTLPLMRGMGWGVYLVSALLITVRLALQPAPRRFEKPVQFTNTSLIVSGVILLAVVVVSLWPRPVTPMSGGVITAATYNIHYGYGEDWGFNLEEMRRALEENGVDVVALQEVDAGRMTSFSIDDAYYLARRLGMNTVYLPTVEGQTGIALLFHGPPGDISSTWITSQQEQTGIIHVEVSGGVHAYAVWMGLSDEDSLRQIREALAFIGDRSPAIFGGDFNARPGSPVYEEIANAGFTDPFEVTNEPTSPAGEPSRRIDYVWLRDLELVTAEVADSTASDHRMVWVRVESDN